MGWSVWRKRDVQLEEEKPATNFAGFVSVNFMKIPKTQQGQKNPTRHFHLALKIFKNRHQKLKRLYPEGKKTYPPRI